MNLDVRLAQAADDQAALFHFRYRVYVEEQRLSPSGSDHGRKWLRDRLDEYSTSYGLWHGDEVVGSLRLTYLADVPDIGQLIEKFEMGPALDHFGLSALCTSSRFMFDARFASSKGMFRVMAAAYRDAIARGVRLVYGDCSAALLPFYRHLGYRAYARPFDDPSYGVKMPLLMLGRDQKWLRQVQSPLARLAKLYPDDCEAREWFDRTYETSQPMC